MPMSGDSWVDFRFLSGFSSSVSYVYSFKFTRGTSSFSWSTALFVATALARVLGSFFFNVLWLCSSGAAAYYLDICGTF